MKKSVVLIAIISSLSVKAQQRAVKGKLKDILNVQPVAGATTYLMTAGELSLVSFTMTGCQDQNHEMNQRPKGVLRQTMRQTCLWNALAG